MSSKNLGWVGKLRKKHIILLIFLIILDQLTKFYFKNKDFSIINYTENTGAAFSILQGYGLLLILLSLVVIVFTIYYFVKIKNPRTSLKIALILILAGTFGNLIDRIFLGAVRDFIDLRIWPIFNLADLYNVLGFLLLLIYFYKKK